MKKLNGAACALVAAVALTTGCKEDTQSKAKATAEKAGETIEMAARDVGDAVNRAAPKAKASLEHAGDKIEETAEDVAQGAKDLTNRAARRTEEATRTPPAAPDDDLAPGDQRR